MKVQQVNLKPGKPGPISRELAEQLINKYKAALYIEVENKPKPRRLLMANTGKGGALLGYVPKDVFKWFKLEEMQEQPADNSCTWFKFTE